MVVGKTPHLTVAWTCQISTDYQLFEWLPTLSSFDQKFVYLRIRSHTGVHKDKCVLIFGCPISGWLSGHPVVTCRSSSVAASQGEQEDLQQVYGQKGNISNLPYRNQLNMLCWPTSLDWAMDSVVLAYLRCSPIMARLFSALEPLEPMVAETKHKPATYRWWLREFVAPCLCCCDERQQK